MKEIINSFGNKPGLGSLVAFFLFLDNKRIAIPTKLCFLNKFRREVINSGYKLFEEIYEFACCVFGYFVFIAVFLEKNYF